MDERETIGAVVLSSSAILGVFSAIVAYTRHRTAQDTKYEHVLEHIEQVLIHNKKILDHLEDVLNHPHDTGFSAKECADRQQDILVLLEQIKEIHIERRN